MKSGDTQIMQDTTTTEFTYGISDGPDGSRWTHHWDVEIEADSAAEALDDACAIAEVELAGLAGSEDYPVGTEVTVRVWAADGRCHQRTVVAEG